MRTWRVGTFSMGASLLFLGVYLLLSQIFKLDVSSILISWWPIIFVILGGEILLYLFFSKQEKPYLKYDIFSIFFVGVLGTVGITIALLSMTGIVDKVSANMDLEHRTGDLPTFDFAMNNDVKRVVVDSGSTGISVEGSTGKELSVFGTYTATQLEKKPLITDVEDYMTTTVKGDTLYIAFKELPRESIAMFQNYSTLDPTLVIPQDVTLEIDGNYNEITMKPRQLTADWDVNNSSAVNVYMSKNSNAELVVSDVGDLNSEKEPNNIVFTEKQDEYDEQQRVEKAMLKYGDGKYTISINNSDYLQIKDKE
ncbi:hypothetical protein [Cytobacillus kochii]|uniref:hypothetical protein n=1 Tax=Cytobacillus kochii TaxID=859143 RepID=UPI001CD424D6|nr:hypothetical protein [Cytobacillus kochii]MCA1028960.1 hypothetical protein [Cytobacillus kochii]MCM3324387.1 hypothetical protein [Cytobacillus kochii]MCM3346781.1 hypothetical protein [Cytobacillus kochii]